MQKRIVRKNFLKYFEIPKLDERGTHSFLKRRFRVDRVVRYPPQIGLIGGEYRFLFRLTLELMNMHRVSLGFALILERSGACTGIWLVLIGERNFVYPVSFSEGSFFGSLIFIFNRGRLALFLTLLPFFLRLISSFLSFRGIHFFFFIIIIIFNRVILFSLNFSWFFFLLIYNLIYLLFSLGNFIWYLLRFIWD